MPGSRCSFPLVCGGARRSTVRLCFPSHEAAYARHVLPYSWNKSLHTSHDDGSSAKRGVRVERTRHSLSIAIAIGVDVASRAAADGFETSEM